MKTKLTITPEINWIIEEFDKGYEEYIYIEKGYSVTNISVPLVHKVYSSRYGLDNLTTLIDKWIKPVITTLKYNGNVTLQGEEVRYWNIFMELVSPWISQGVHIHNTTPATVEYSKGVQ